jgi:hypothetical protein
MKEFEQRCSKVGTARSRRGYSTFHKGRRYNIKCCASVEELVSDIIGEKCVLCQGWKLNGYFFLNDSFRKDGIFDVAMLKHKNQLGNRAVCDQLDSITVDLYTAEELKEYIRRAMASEVIPYGEEIVTVETPEEHRECIWCVENAKQWPK